MDFKKREKIIFGKLFFEPAGCTVKRDNAFTPQA
jgi:hypothetical protein